ncbi:MAG: HAMP domain-containing protein [Proteobacteria bacterium]|nr:HAMP domain-containing protein [Pseudomonadota bacterium]
MARAGGGKRRGERGAALDRLRPARRFRFKLVAVMLLIALIPLVASALLVDQVISVSDGVAAGQARALVAPLRQAADAYRALFRAQKQLFRQQTQLFAVDEPLRRAVRAGERGPIVTRLAQLAAQRDGVRRLRVLAADGSVLADAAHAQPAGEALRPYRWSRPVAGTTTRLEATFVASGEHLTHFAALATAQRAALEIDRLRRGLAPYYRIAFLSLLGLALVLATAGGLVFAGRTVRRVTALLHGTRRVAAGDLETRVEAPASDELGQLARSFNLMVEQLRESRDRIAYLEKIGAWQGVARRLAHEIKNPLTPIQLVVQQLFNKYSGDDLRFQRLLTDAHEIVTEEVQGLRRLVEEFSAFAKLPAVQAEAVEIDLVLDDFLKSYSELAERTQAHWTPLGPGHVVLVDRMLIKHVLHNLLENALQAAAGPGARGSAGLRVELTARLPLGAGELALQVRDNGPGIDREAMEQVFDPYFTTKERGTGLGLAIVKKIVLEHGGAVLVRAAPEGGAEFVITLPLAEGSADLAGEEASP